MPATVSSVATNVLLKSVPAPRLTSSRQFVPSSGISRQASVSAAKDFRRNARPLSFRTPVQLRTRARLPIAPRRDCVQATQNSAADLSPSSETKSSNPLSVLARMHDFCLTIPYGFLILLGGVLGAALKGSMKSLMMGGGTGALLMGLGFLSLTTWKSGKSSMPITALSTVISGGLTYMMGKRYLATGAIFPSGVIAALSGAMVLFYLMNMVTGGNPLKKEDQKDE